METISCLITANNVPEGCRDCDLQDDARKLAMPLASAPNIRITKTGADSNRCVGNL